MSMNDGSGGSSQGLQHRIGSKRTYSAMAASHRDSTSPHHSASSLFLPATAAAATHDDHYTNEQEARRRRLRLSASATPSRFVGDGLDFRRPVVNPETQPRASGVTTIDLTEGDDDEGGGEEEVEEGRGSREESGVIEVEDDDEEDEDGDEVLDDLFADAEALPGANYLALPGHQRTHPQFSIIRPRRPLGTRADEDNSSLGANHSNRSTPRPRQDGHPLRQAMNYISNQPRPSEAIDLTEDDDDDVIFTESRPRENTGVNLEAPEAPPGAATRTGPDRMYQNLGNIAELLRSGSGRLMDRLHHLAGFDDQPPDHNLLQRHPNDQRDERRARRVVAATRAPHAYRTQPAHLQNYIGGMMNYALPAFQMGIPQPTRPAYPPVHAAFQPPSPPRYSPPLPPGDGFTRSPGEYEIIVCPNCGDELGMGKSDLKQQLWVLKKCGHAYCAECAQSSMQSARVKKGKGKGKEKEKEKYRDDDPDLPPPVKRCVVPDCGKPASHNSWVHTYLGS